MTPITTVPAQPGTRQAACGPGEPAPTMRAPRTTSVSSPRGAGPAGPAGRRPAPARPRHGSARPVPGAARGGAARAGTSAGALALAFATLYLEVECGRRAASQLAPLMDPELHARLEARWVRLHQPLGRVRSVTTTACGRHIDAVVVVQRGRRAGALALRLTRFGGRWRVTAACRPEDGPLPPVPWIRPALATTPGEGSPPEHERYLALAGCPG